MVFLWLTFFAVFFLQTSIQRHGSIDRVLMGDERQRLLRRVTDRHIRSHSLTNNEFTGQLSGVLDKKSQSLPRALSNKLVRNLYN